MSKTTNKFAPEVRERAIRMVLEHERDYPLRWATDTSALADGRTQQGQRAIPQRISLLYEMNMPVFAIRLGDHQVQHFQFVYRPV
jgi:hypothetical protein